MSPTAQVAGNVTPDFSGRVVGDPEKSTFLLWACRSICVWHHAGCKQNACCIQNEIRMGRNDISPDYLTLLKVYSAQPGNFPQCADPIRKPVCDWFFEWSCYSLKIASLECRSHFYQARSPKMRHARSYGSGGLRLASACLPLCWVRPRPGRP